MSAIDVETFTITFHFKGALTEAERDTIKGNLKEHVFEERKHGIPGFAKVDRCTVDSVRTTAALQD